MSQFTRILSALAALVLALSASQRAFGQGAQPGGQGGLVGKPIRIIVGASPGGGIDIVARALAQKMTEISGQPTIVENRPGASTTIGAAAVAKAAPDGHTLFMASTSFAVAGGLYKDLSYDSVKDFAPVTLVASGPLVLVVNPAVPATNVKELIAWAKSKQGRVVFGSAGAGTSVHLAGELFRLTAGFDYTHVPYKGGAPAATDLMGGHVDMVFDVVVAMLPHIKSGKARAIAVTGRERSPLLPGVPTVAESGLPDFEVAGWYGMLAPAGTPRETINRLHDTIAKALAAPDLRERLAAQAADPIGDGPDKWGPYLQAEVAKWSRVIKQAGIRAD